MVARWGATRPAALAGGSVRRVAGETAGRGPAALHVRGVVLPDGERRDLYAVGGRLTYEPQPGAETVADRGWVVPGLVDCHCHVGLSPDGAVRSEEGLAEQARADRDAGALLLRDAGAPVDNRSVQAREDLPRLVRAGRHLARPKRYLRDIGIEVEPDELVAAVEEQAGRGDGWVKLVGDWIDRSVGDLAPLWPGGVLAAAVDRAHQLGVRVAVHAFGEDALPDLVAAGVDTIEHATGLSGALAGEVARRGIRITPTLINIETFPSIADSATKFPAYAAHMRALHGTARSRVRDAYEAGVRILVGSDAGGTLPHGLVVREIRALHEAGLPAAAALAAGSWDARDFLGLPGLVEGAPADLVVYADDPRADLATLAAPTRIVLRGRVVR
jgi:imidazolonepropionase-like amidohydrolase